MKEAMQAVLMGLFLTAVAALAIYEFQPPEPVSDSAPASEFSSARAMQHLKVIAAHPHPIGTPEHAKVREYILEQLQGLGLEPSVQTANVTRSRSVRLARFATVQNVVARIPGTNPSKAILLLSHYDTVPNSPGATDDGAGVVAMLETARALLQTAPLKNDVIFLFTDGEEVGLMGAKAFVEQHPWAKDVGLVLNFEGSGSGGPVLMFETSDENGWLIDEFAKAALHPTANSLSYEIYRRMPNDTDLSIFKQAGVAGLNFAFIDDRYDYHTNNDNLENIDEGSIQHHGSYALSLSRHFGNLDLADIRADNAVYFNVLRFRVVSYPESWVPPLTYLAILVFGLTTVLGFRAKRLQCLGILKGLLILVVSLVLIPIAINFIFGILGQTFAGVDWWLLYYNHGMLLLGFVFLAIAALTVLLNWLQHGITIRKAVFLVIVMLLLQLFAASVDLRLFAISIIGPVLLYLVFRKKIGEWSLTFGHLTGWMILVAVVSWVVPGGSYLFMWPFLFSMIPLIVIFSSERKKGLSNTHIILLGICAIPGVFWFSEIAYLIYIAMGINLSWLPIVFVLMLAGLLLPHLQIMMSRRWLLEGTTATLGGGLIMWLVLTAEFDERYRKPNTLFYAYDGNSGESFWVTTDANTDQWTGHYISSDNANANVSEILPTVSAPMLKTPGPVTTIDPPQLEILHESVEDARRKIALRLTSTRGAANMNIFIDPKARIEQATVNEIEVDSRDNIGSRALANWWHWRYYGVPDEGIEITLDLATTDEFKVKVVDLSPGLPNPETPLRPRYQNMMPAPYTFSDMTIASKTFLIPAWSQPEAN
ncbi:M20/M25/M40 family metallo-hydrolase [bacterium]|nr:M20/M25/M40 family metallo-hydrolase [bacterium]